MDKVYADTVRLLLAIAPDVFRNDIFALKGRHGDQSVRAGHAAIVSRSGYRLHAVADTA